MIGDFIMHYIAFQPRFCYNYHVVNHNGIIVVIYGGECERK